MRKHESDTNRARMNTNWIARRRREGGSPLSHPPYSCPEHSRRAALHPSSPRYSLFIIRSSSRLGLIAKRSKLVPSKVERLNAKVNPRSRVQDCTRRSGFTLLELIVVMAILSILTVAVVLVVDPLEMIARANDTARLSDLAAVDDALQFAVANGPSPEKGGVDLDAGNTNTCAGESSQTVYVSVPNSETPPTNLPTGWSYGQVSAANLQNVNGFGWIPVDMTNAGSVTPSISNLPIDSTNTFASGYYYTYVCSRNPHFELTARMASDKYWTGGSEDKASTDGGDDPFLYEEGTNIDLNPLGPVGYWDADDWDDGGAGPGTLKDSTGNGHAATAAADTNDPTLVSDSTGTYLTFDGTSDYLSVPENDDFDPGDADDLTMMITQRSSGVTGVHRVLIRNLSSWGNGGYGYQISINANATIYNTFTRSGSAGIDTASAGWNYATDGNIHVSALRRFGNATGTNDVHEIWTDGVLRNTAQADIGTLDNSTAVTIGAAAGGSSYADMDFYSAAIWNRALSPAEILITANIFNP